jgi:hypothetical protein
VCGRSGECQIFLSHETSRDRRHTGKLIADATD